MRWPLLLTILLAACAPALPPTAAPVASTATASPTARPTATPAPTATPSPTPDPAWPFTVPWTVDCTDDVQENGYENQGYCVPGLVTWDASRFQNPGSFSGAISSYGEGIAEGVCGYRATYLDITCSKYKGFVAVMGCGDIGKRAMIRRPGHDWDGPFLIVDCSGRKDVAVNVIQKRLAAEVDYATAQRWGQLTVGWADVRVIGNGGGYDGLPLREWYLNEALAFEVDGAPLLSEPTACPPGLSVAHALSVDGVQYPAGCYVPPTSAP